jgi:hypothetical protein
MLGIEDKWVAGVYLLCLGSTILCVIYGAINWNRGGNEMGEEDVKWAAKEKKAEEEF